MTKEEIKALVRSGIRKNDTLPLSDLAALKSIANVTLEIDRETNDYFYRIYLDELVNKEFEYKLLTENGWELSLDEEQIYLFL